MTNRSSNEGEGMAAGPPSLQLITLRPGSVTNTGDQNKYSATTPAATPAATPTATPATLFSSVTALTRQENEGATESKTEFVQGWKLWILTAG